MFLEKITVIVNCQSNAEQKKNAEVFLCDLFRVRNGQMRISLHQKTTIREIGRVKQLVEEGILKINAEKTHTYFGVEQRHVQRSGSKYLQSKSLSAATRYQQLLQET